MKATFSIMLFVLALPISGLGQVQFNYLSYEEVSSFLRSGDSANFQRSIEEGDSVRLSVHVLNYRRTPSIQEERRIQFIGRSLRMISEDIKKIPREYELAQALTFYIGEQAYDLPRIADRYYDQRFKVKQKGSFSIQLPSALFIEDRTHYAPNSLQSIDYQIMGQSGQYIPFIYAIRLEVNGEVIFWDRDQDAQIARIQQFNKSYAHFRPLVHDPDDVYKYLFVYAQNTQHEIAIWELGNTEPLKVYKGGHNADIVEVKLNQVEPPILISVDQSGKVCLWDTKGVSSYPHSTFMIDGVAPGDQYSSMTVTVPVGALAFSPKGDLIASASHRIAPYGSDYHYDFRVKIYDINRAYSQSGNPLIRELHAHKTGVDKVTFSEDGKKLVSRDGNRLTCVWDTETWKLLSKEVH